MARPKRVLSFMSEWGGHSSHRRNASTTSAASPRTSPAPPSPSAKQFNASSYSVSSSVYGNNPEQARPEPDSRPSSRPMSMIQTYQPPVMEVSQDTLPELQRIFMFLNSHSNKLYQEGYFLKFHDTDARGRPAPDRVWQECFAQLVGTILSLWDASELDNVRSDAEVLPTFINLTDAAIHMMPSMTLGDGKRLDNILSVSTAASNKYLFHFNSFNSLTQWTAGIRLAMYEHTSLQEAYTGALIAGKGRSLNNIRIILDRQRAKYEDWVRVRFGAGTPWRRCWCVVTPPDEKELAKLQKSQKKKDIYDRSPVVLKGDIRFYDSQKVKKKTMPIATVKDAYSCYAIYPQSKQLIDQSTLVKVEGKIKIHSNPEKVTEGFVFIMPETRPAVSGFEIMLQFLFPVFDTFNLYGRPNKLIADVLDTRGLMFAMPPDRRYGYLEMWDVVSLIHSQGSENWSERQWRKQLKDLTSTRISTTPRDRSRAGSRRNTVSRTSLAPSRNGTIRFEENGSARSQPTTRQPSPTRANEFEVQAPRKTDSAPPVAPYMPMRHQRSVSEQTNGYKQYQSDTPSRLAQSAGVDDQDIPPTPPPHGQFNGTPETSDNETPSPGTQARDLPEVQSAPTAPPHGPVASPPTFSHTPSQRPPVQPVHAATMKPNAHMDPATLHQLADATNTPLPLGIAAAGAAAAWRSRESVNGERNGGSEIDANQNHLNANHWGNSGNQYSQSGNRLPTIPASPYVEHEQFVDSSTTYQPSGPPVPEHAELQRELVSHSRPGSGDQQQIHRKPVPGRSSMPPRGDDTRSIHSTTSSSLGSLRNDVVDPEALDRLNNTEPTLLRQFSKSSSRYSNDDGLSTSTPDYASTIEEEPEPPKPERRMPDRPRSGMLKTIGNPDLNPKADIVVGDTHYAPNAKPATVSADIPAIDFGPTYSLDPLDPNAKRPGTSGTMTQAFHDSSFSQSRENLAPLTNEEIRQSYSGRTTPITAMHMRSSSASPQASENRRSVAWQPGMAAQPHSDRQKLEPEEWVAQRAAAAAVSPRTPPAFNHGRSKSHTPPLSRMQSGDWSHLQRTPEGAPARPPSRPLSRPLSRGAERLLDQRPTSLSAREQEHVARMTNTPLVDLTKNAKKEQKPNATGLTAYIDHREKEKVAAKANKSTLAMQAEVDRRMMAAQQRQMLEMQHMGQQTQMGQPMAMTAGGYGAPSVMGAPSMMGTPSMLGTPQGYAPAFAYSSPGQMQQLYHQQQGGYFPQQGMPQQGMQQQGQGWGPPSPMPHVPGQFPQTPPLQGAYFGQGQAGGQQQGQQQQQNPVTQPYGASFDQAQAAARFAHQQGQGRR